MQLKTVKVTRESPEALLDRWNKDPAAKQRELEHITRTHYDNARCQRNARHLAQALADDDRVHRLFADPARFRQVCQMTIDSKEHSRRKQLEDEHYDYDEIGTDVRKLSDGQFLRIYLLLRHLARPEAIDDICAQVEADIADRYAEHGGIVIHEPGSGLRFYDYESEHAKERKRSNNGSYQLPYLATKVPCLFEYHIHAVTRNDTDYAGPSHGKRRLDWADMSICDQETRDTGESHNLVITKLRGPAFNVDYYGGIRHRRSIALTVLDIGNYAYTRPDQERGFLSALMSIFS